MPTLSPFRVLALPVALCLASAPTALAAEAATTVRPVDTVALHSVRLWDGDAPLAKGTAPEDRPHLDVLLAPKEHATGCAMIICPGGGFRERAMDWEGLQVAQWLNSQGIHAFLLSYRMRGGGYERPAAELDSARAMRYVRAHAADFGVNPRRIGMIGFSAGGVLVETMAAKFTAGDPQAADPVERVASRPDFVASIYGIPDRQDGVTTKPVPANTPPTFMVLTLADEAIDPKYGLRELEALRQAGVEAELHVFGGDGTHGRGLHVGDPYTGTWPTLLINWLRRNALLTDRERVPVEGVMTIDGVAMFAGWVTFTPVDDPNLPAASIFYNDKYRKFGQPGHYYIPQKYGPVPGRYRVEVIHASKDFILVPSMDSAHRYDRLSPDAEPIVVEVKPGPNVIDLAIRSK